MAQHKAGHPIFDDSNVASMRCFSRKPTVVRDKDRKIETWMHYSDARSRQETTVFGEAAPNLFYNYDDRLKYEDKWDEGLAIAKTKASENTARFYEIVLSHFHGKPVDIQHIVLGVNRSNGHSYLIFGYTH